MPGERTDRDDILRLGTWNCKMGLRNKAGAVNDLDLDLCVLPECSSDDLVALSGGRGVWIGENPTKGLGVLSPRGTFDLTQLPPAAETPHFLPVRCAGVVDLTVIAVWSFAYRRGVSALAEALAAQAAMLGPSTVMVGDFNAGVAIDHGRKFHPAARWLADQGMVSAYHVGHGVDYGDEPDPTYWHRHLQDEPFHIDYCFLPAAWTDRLEGVTVGRFEDWRQLSDHAPVVVEMRVVGLRQAAAAGR